MMYTVKTNVRSESASDLNGLFTKVMTLAGKQQASDRSGSGFIDKASFLNIFWDLEYALHFFFLREIP